MNVRITPADAGKTSMQAQQAYKIRDHPRRCGENVCKLIHFANILGSPPQVRGKRRPHHGGISKVGITPAGAGKTFGRNFETKAS